MPKGKRNEALDCRVYGLAALHILNPNLDALRSEQERQNLKKQEAEPPATKTEGWIGYDDWNFN